jgi:hypothetical protein
MWQVARNEAAVLQKCGCIALQAESGERIEFLWRFLDGVEFTRRSRASD